MPFAQIWGEILFYSGHSKNYSEWIQFITPTLLSSSVEQKHSISLANFRAVIGISPNYKIWPREMAVLCRRFWRVMNYRFNIPPSVIFWSKRRTSTFLICWLSGWVEWSNGMECEGMVSDFLVSRRWLHITESSSQLVLVGRSRLVSFSNYSSLVLKYYWSEYLFRRSRRTRSGDNLMTSRDWVRIRRKNYSLR